jgi:DNA repair protein RadA/Sms
MAKPKVTYCCNDCGYKSPVHLGKCPECGSWGSLEAQTTIALSPSASTSTHHAALWDSAPNSGAGVGFTGGVEGQGLIALQAVRPEMMQRFSTGFDEFDRVLGGGMLPGAYVLIAGDPGIGKSTLMLQAAAQMARPTYADNGDTEPGKRVWYVAGEESPQQIHLRAERLGLLDAPLEILSEVRLPQILELITKLPPDVLIVDSVQALYDPNVASPPGSTTQIRTVANQLMPVAKLYGVTVLLVGHVTKEGNVSGPKLLEHMVDVVITFEGEKYKDLRLLRTLKNRFGSTQEIGVFEMAEGGLREITNPSELFLGERWMNPLPGCVTTCTLEGSRPLLVEIQALVGQSTYPSPRRVVNGIETNRLHQIVAVLERRLGLDFSNQDLYVNVVGGLHIDEPAADLAIAMALITNLRNLSVSPGTVVLGEIGLTGEIRPVRRWRERIREAAKIGFQRVVFPASSEDGGAQTSAKESWTIEGIDTVMVTTLREAVTASLEVPSPPGDGKEGAPPSPSEPPPTGRLVKVS